MADLVEDLKARLERLEAWAKEHFPHVPLFSEEPDEVEVKVEVEDE